MEKAEPKMTAKSQTLTDSSTENFPRQLHQPRFPGHLHEPKQLNQFRHILTPTWRDTQGLVITSRAAAGSNSTEISNRFPCPPAPRCFNHPHFEAAPRSADGLLSVLQRPEGLKGYRGGSVPVSKLSQIPPFALRRARAQVRPPGTALPARRAPMAHAGRDQWLLKPPLGNTYPFPRGGSVSLSQVLTY